MFGHFFRELLALLEPLVLLDFRDSLVYLVLEETVVHLVLLVLWYVKTKTRKKIKVQLVIRGKSFNFKTVVLFGS